MPPSPHGHAQGDITGLSELLAGIVGGTLSGIGGVKGTNGQMDDTELEAGTIFNAGAGWNTFRFREAFEDVPTVVAVSQEFSGWVEIRSVTATGFLYCLRRNKLTTSPTSGYMASGSSADSGHSSRTYLADANLTTETVADRVAISYIALDYGGER